ncbi:MAG: sulfite exporter TauE/SafE family protein [Cyanobacteriota bacterium]|nr:sulfite exporter TauE/SafE family protein [Cyanobacteriota bacterium]
MSAAIVGHFLAAAIGASLGLIGGGGSILAVPVLVYVMGIAPKSAIAMSLVIVGTVSFLGAIPHWRLGNVRVQIALMFAPTAMLGAYLGARLAALPFITDTVQMGLFAVTMLLAAVLMIYKSVQPSPTASELEEQGSEPTSKHRHVWFLVALEGLGVGLLTGLVGVGGGFAIVPALVLLENIPIKQAAGTSLSIIALKSATGFLGYLGQVELDWQLMASFTLAASGGTLLGVYFVPSIKAQQLQKGLGGFLLLIAGFILWQNWLRGDHPG